MGRNRIWVSHFTICRWHHLFCRASFEELHSLKLILLVFGRLSGLRINLNNSTLLGINISPDQTTRLASLLDCAVSDWPLSYLHLGGNPNSLSSWDPVLDRVSRRLDGWKKVVLSLGERITLIQYCLSHIPSYFLSLFKVPISIALRIEKLQRDFLWLGSGEGKRDHLVN